jgi:microcin C transport system permease protein
MKFFNLSPLTVKRLQRFRRSKIAFGSLCVLLGVYLFSLCSELIANSEPLMMRFNGKTYFPFLHSSTPEEILSASGEKVRVNYRQFTSSETFTKDEDNYAIFAPIRYSPHETVDLADIEDAREVTVSYVPTQPLARFNLTEDGAIIRQDNCEQFFHNITLDDEAYKLTDIFELDDATQAALQARFKGNTNCDAYTTELKVKENIEGIKQLVFHLPAFNAKRAKGSLRVHLRTQKDESTLYRQPYLFTFEKADNDLTLLKTEGPGVATDEMLAHAKAQALREYDNPKSKRTQQLTTREQQTWICPTTQTSYTLSLSDNANFPFRPTGGHIFGLDESGRDVFVRILYATRIGLSFGLILAMTATVLGIIIGAIQGYFGGKLDICIQRFTEIWAALPFLYIMALLGNLLGRSFGLLLLVYGCFCWIGLSYYMRAEFLRLRNRPFVAAARCLGLSNRRIIFSHILPNALTPVITLFPFLLVGAIGTLVSLDFLGFGLPPLTPSWGELLSQAQVHRSSWWLIVFPTAAIFIVMFSTVMVGEGVRNAFDPKPFSKLQ